MTRTSASLSLLLPALIFALAAPRVCAQATAGSGATSTSTGGVSWVLNKVGAAAYTDTSYLTPINKAQCDANAALTFSLTNIPPGNKYLEVWAGVSCADGNRTTRIGTSIPCNYVTYKEQQDPTGTTADTNFVVPSKPLCDLGDGSRQYWVLPVNTLMGSDTISVYANVTLNVDTTPPEAPTKVKAGSGETQIPVEWTQPADSFYYWVVIDTNVGTPVDAGTLDGSLPSDDSGVTLDASTAGVGGASVNVAGVGGAAGTAGSSGFGGASGNSGAGGSTTVGIADPACPSQFLIPGMAFDPDTGSLPKGVISKYIKEKASRATFSEDEIGTKGGAVAVIAEDLGKNRSVLSNIACLKVVKTSGFWDNYRSGGGDAAQGCACSAPGAGQRAAKHSAWYLLAALGLLGAWWRTRRRT
jgi:hypothetical protein